MSEPIPTDPVVDPDFPPEEPEPPVYEEPVPGPELPVADGWTEAEISGARVNVFDAPIVAGDPAGARIEIRSTGFHAFNGTGVETAHIDGAEGVFVGGEFRTSDTLPGQVTLSDTAAGGGPGILVEPDDTTGYAWLPWIGPTLNGMAISGGVGTGGGQAGIDARHDISTLWHNGPGVTGSGSWAETRSSDVTLTYRPDRSTSAEQSQVSAAAGFANMHSRRPGALGNIAAHPDHVVFAVDTDNGHGEVAAGEQSAQLMFRNAESQGWIYVNGEEAYLSRTAGGVVRYLSVDANGVWVKTNRSGTWKQYNLEETAQDSGWQALTLASGVASTGSPAWRNKGGVIYYRGTLTNSTGWGSGWNALATDVGDAATPDANMLRSGASSATNNMLLQVTTAGRLEMWLPTSLAGSTTVQLSPMFYPLG